MAAREENSEGVLRSLFRLLRTMDTQELESDKPMQTTAVRRV